jgi:CHAD domain-containing protein
MAGKFSPVMRAGVATFTAHDQDPVTVIARLAGMGFEFGPSRPLIRSLLDTFDGRLHGAGLRLELCECDDLELILTGEGSAAAHLTVPSVPRFPDDLPLGPFRSRLTAVTDVRALLPVLRVTATRSAGRRHNHAGKTVATVMMYEQVRSGDHEVAQWMIEVDELAGYAEYATKARNALAQIGLSRLNCDALTIAATAAGVDLRGASRPIVVPLDPAMPAIVGFRAVLAELSDTIVANWPGTVEHVDPEFLHDLRVAVRRTRTILREGKKVLPRALVERAEERLGWLGAVTGPARDLDVHLVNWTTYSNPLTSDVVAALQPVRVRLEQRSRSAHDTLTQVLGSAEAAELMTTAATWWREPAAHDPSGVRGDRPLGSFVAKRIARTHERLVKRGRSIHPDSPPQQVHDLRKDAKRLRYLLESFAGLLNDAPRKAFVRRLKTLQDNLGEHHDAAIHVTALRDISRELHFERASPETMLAIGQLIAQLDQRRIATRDEFADHFVAYDTKATQRALDAALAGARR